MLSSIILAEILAEQETWTRVSLKQSWKHFGIKQLAGMYHSFHTISPPTGSSYNFSLDTSPV